MLNVSVAVGALGEMSYCGRVAQAACLIEGNSQHYYHGYYHHCCRVGHYIILLIIIFNFTINGSGGVVHWGLTQLNKGKEENKMKGQVVLWYTMVVWMRWVVKIPC